MVDTTALTGTWTLDLAHTRIGFSARHAMVTKVRGHFAEFEGTAHIDGENPSASSVNVTIQTASIDTNNKMRDDHLRTNDFLEADKYPTIAFNSTKVGSLARSAGLTARGVRVEIPSATARSMATPMWPSASGRLGVTPISITLSRRPGISSTKGVPAGHSLGKMTIPS